MPLPRTSSNILVVEDEWLIALDIGMMIEDDGHVVIGPVRSVAAALGLIRSTSIQAAFLDINLGAETSFSVAQELERRDIPFTFVSAYEKDVVPSSLGTHDLLTKPVPVQLLADSLRKMLTPG